ncbi:MAG: MerR family transcriptional regulator [Clostridiales bacterium]|nr:MerR family transcriptional regulator [Clostridiales bacterium]
MTLEEASKRFGVDLDKLKNYEKNGLLTPIEILASGEKQYTEEEVRKIGVIGSLLKAGLAYEDIRQYLSQSNSGTENTEEILRILRQHRYSLLENIHEKQRLLDEIDYLIDDMRKKFYKGKRKD